MLQKWRKKHTRHTWRSLEPFTSSFNQNNKYSLFEHARIRAYQPISIGNYCVCVRAHSQQYKIYQICRMEGHKTTMMFRLSGIAGFFLNSPLSLSLSLIHSHSSMATSIFWIFFLHIWDRIPFHSIPFGLFRSLPVLQHSQWAKNRLNHKTKLQCIKGKSFILHFFSLRRLAFLPKGNS